MAVKGLSATTKHTTMHSKIFLGGVVTGGFVPVAAEAFIGQHSYATPDRPMAEGRPDARDLAGAEAFGAASCIGAVTISLYSSERSGRCSNPSASLSRKRV